MTLRDRVSAATKDAMKAKDADRLSTLRLVSAAIKDRDIAVRADGNDAGVDEAGITAILSKMVKQRQESVRAYEDAGRVELAEKERTEITVLEEFLPKQLTGDEVTAAIDAAIQAVGASSLRDMGPVMGVLKSKYTGQMDFGAVGPLVKERLS